MGFEIFGIWISSWLAIVTICIVGGIWVFWRSIKNADIMPDDEYEYDYFKHKEAIERAKLEQDIANAITDKGTMSMREKLKKIEKEFLEENNYKP